VLHHLRLRDPGTDAGADVHADLTFVTVSGHGEAEAGAHDPRKPGRRWRQTGDHEAEPATISWSLTGGHHHESPLISFRGRNRTYGGDDYVYGLLIARRSADVTRRLTLAAVLALAAGGLAAGCGDDAAPSTGSSPSRPPATTAAPPGATTTPTATPEPTEPAPTARFEVAKGKVVSGPRTVEVAVGSEVIIEVVTDRNDELHVHGYDKEVAVRPGRPGRVAFTADVAGVFEVELHSGVRLCNLRVR
jgi:hypothetical protein